MRRLSEIRGEEAFDVTADLLVEISKLVSGDKIKAMREDGKSNVEIITYIVKKKKSNVVKILSILDGCTPKEYLEKTNMPTLFNDAKILMEDPMVRELFTLQGQSVGSDNSGSVMETTEEEA